MPGSFLSFFMHTQPVGWGRTIRESSKKKGQRKSWPQVQLSGKPSSSRKSSMMDVPRPSLCASTALVHAPLPGETVIFRNMSYYAHSNFPLLCKRRSPAKPTLYAHPLDPNLTARWASQGGVHCANTRVSFALNIALM